jgi:hypothetical protein
LPRIIETVCSVAVVWANLAYLMVSVPLLIMRLRGWPRPLFRKWAYREGEPPGEPISPASAARQEPRPPASETGSNSHSASDHTPHREFSLGRWGLPVNLVAIVWGVFIVVNMCWPRVEIYGDDPWGQYAAVIATVLLLGLGLSYYLAVQRRRTGILSEHAAPSLLGGGSLDLDVLANSNGLITQLAPGD